MAEPQVIQQTQTSIPDYAKRYVEDLLGQGAATIYRTSGTDASGMPIISGFQPFRAYQGERTAQFTPLQQQAAQAAGQLQVPGQMYDASRIAKQAATMAGQSAYSPTNFQAGMAMAPNLERFQMGPAQQVYSRESNAPTMTAAQVDYDPNLRNYQMGPAQQVRTQSFAQPGAAEAYMSPYMQNVVDIQKREAQRQAGIASTQRGAQFAKAGAFGGGRQAIENAEAQRNLATQMGDIQATGLQNAYQQSQQQFAADQARALQASLANQQAGLTVGGQNLQSLQATQQLGTQTGLQTSLANLNAAQQAGVQNMAAYLQTQGMNSQQALQAALANQQAGLTVGQQNLQSLQGTQQLGAQTSMQAQLANQQAMQNAAQLREQSAQYGAGFGLQGLQTAMQGAGQLGQLGQNIYGQTTGNINLQSQLGGQQQQQVQNVLSNQYQDYLQQENMPYRQLGFMSDLLRGTAGLGQSSIYQYQQQPSTTSQLVGMGTTLAGISKLGLKEGGAVSAGLADLAIANMA